MLLAGAVAPAQDIALPDAGAAPEVSPFSVSLNYELAIPSGSHGLWDAGSGAVLTGMYKLPLSQKFFFEPGLAAYYNTMGVDYIAEDEAVYEGTVKNIGLRVPLMFGLHLRPSDRFDLDISTGPWLNVNLYARRQAMPDVDAPVPVPQSINLFRKGFKRVEGLWGLKLSATFKDHYIVGITASTAFTPLASYGNRDNKIRIRRSTVGIMLGYRF